MAVGLALLVATLILRGANANRHVRGRLMASAFAFAAYALAGVGASYVSLSAELQQQLRAVQPLLLAFGVINAAVALVINPWRTDRLPDRFPTIVQDSIVIGLFAVAATLILQERIFATTAVGAVVIGFALQDTLGNLFAGLAIQIEKPFRVGHWVNVAGKDGMVSEITWRATKIRTKAGNFVIVPNSALSRDTITNYSEPMPETRIELDIGASYDTPPNRVKATILAAIKNEPLIAGTRPPEVLLADFAASAITYRVRAWTTDFALDDIIRDRIRTSVYYAFHRAGIVIPYPIQVEMFREDVAPAVADPKIAERLLEAVQIFATLPSDERAQLAQAASQALYAAGEAIVREGEAGSSMFVVARGEMVVTLGPAAHEVARLGPGDVFGEMSLLTGAPRTATVTAVTDAELLEITAGAFRQFVLANPTAVEQIGGAVAARAAELEEHRAAGAAAEVGVEESRTFLARVRQFLGLSRAIIVAAAFTMMGSARPLGLAPGQPPAGPNLPVYGYGVVRTYPHDRDAFTQGLQYLDGFLYEGTGLNGRSSIRKVKIETGEVVQRRDVPAQYFGEGIVVWQSELFQLTWQSGVAFIYDRGTFAPRRTAKYQGEGWGLTHDGTSLVMSDGSDSLRFLDPATFAERRRLRVTAGGVALRNLNELEQVKGEIFANVWQTDYVARIDPKTGRVAGWVDLQGLLSPRERASTDVLNGIAYDAAGDRLFVTGKLWPRLFEIKLLRTRARRAPATSGPAPSR